MFEGFKKETEDKKVVRRYKFNFGPKGQKGADGLNGKEVTQPGKFSILLEENGDLILQYHDGDTPPDIQIIDGQLIYTY